MRGLFISIEGVEGAGKSTQLNNIKHYLESIGKAVLVTREPGGTELGEHIRSLLLTPSDSPMAIDTELLLMFAARAEHVNKVINPALERGEWVISDRFTDATYAYQGGGRGIDVDRISQLAEWTLQGMQPDLTLLFDLPVEIGQQRVISRNEGIDRFEQEKVDFFYKIRTAYLELARTHSRRIKVIDSSRTVDVIEQELIALLSKLDVASA
jgi:dTMP kinase